MYHIIKSSDATNGLIKLTDPLQNEYELHSLTFTNNVTNVNAYNNILPYHEGSTLTNIELTQQYVDGTDLATDVQDKINAITAGTATVEYNANACAFTISNTTGFSLKFGDNTSNTCDKLLGFSQTNTASSTTHTSDSIADLTAFKYICMTINEACNSNVVDQSYNSNTFLIQGRSDFGDKFEFITDSFNVIRQKMTLKPTKTLKVAFSDDENNGLTLANWILILKSSV